jgi:hypothetical protein
MGRIEGPVDDTSSAAARSNGKQQTNGLLRSKRKNEVLTCPKRIDSVSAGFFAKK